MVKDMTTGKPLPLIFRFFIPLLLGNLFQQFYSMVDSIIVGKFVGVNALAGVGATGALNFLILGFAMGICGGFGIMFGQKFGAKDYKGMRNYIANAYYLTLAISGVLTPLTMIFCRKILVLMKTPDEIMEEAYAYIIVILAGIVVSMFYNIAAAVLRAIGDSKTPLYALIGASILNIGLDLLFVLEFHMGTFGVGLDTVISQGVSGFVCIIYMYKKYEILQFQKGEKKADATKMVHLLGTGIPMALQFSITAIGSIIIQSAVNSLGAIAVAAMTAGSKINMLFSGALEMIGMSVATYCSQNRGAREDKRIRSGVRSGIFLTCISCGIVITIIQLLGKEIALLFIDESQVQIMKYIIMFLKYNSDCFLLLGILFVMRNALQGMGYSFIAMFAGVSELIGRLVVAFALVETMGFEGVCLANPVAWFLADVILVLSYVYAVKKMKEKEKQSL
ncbi:MAG: MATE family efflux transporter [Acetivibrio sp.]